MSILIKGMKMPKDCSECRFCEWKDGNDVGCVATGKGADDCPLIPIPDHGDLIDRDALFDDNSWDWFNEWGSTVNKQAQLVADAPAVIPAERSKE